MSKASWNPEQYLRFQGERLQPALDLIARLHHPAPQTVFDLGCGTGSGTDILRTRFPDARITGVDSSPDMLKKARAQASGADFVQADLANWTADRPADVIFSNAALQWLPDHTKLFPHLFAQLAPGGVFAVQMPAMHDEPLRRLQPETAAAGPWAAKLRQQIKAAHRIEKPEFYRDLLAPRAQAFEMWETIYWHALKGEDAAVQWAMGTSLRPYMDALEEPERSAFIRAYADAVRPHYPCRSDGVTLLPFRRFFLLARA